MGAIKDIFRKPSVSAPTPLPDVNDNIAKAAAQKAREEAKSRKGRASTILTKRPTSEAGTASYTNTYLGQSG